MLNYMFSVCMRLSFHFSLYLQAYTRETHVKEVQTLECNMLQKTVHPNGDYLVQNTPQGMFKHGR
jgi:hypothetical protein